MGCKYCQNILSNSPSRDRAVHDRILFESENFIAVPTVGSLVEGWLLVISKEHHIRMASLEYGLLEELNCFKEQLSRVIEECYGPIAIFEHGPSVPMQAIGCGIDHAHLHIVPTSCRLVQALRDMTHENLKWVDLEGVSGLRSYRDSEQEYLFVEQPLGAACVAASHGFGSQLFRRVIARHIGVPDRYDWKCWTGTENVVRTAERLTSRLEGNSPTPD